MEHDRALGLLSLAKKGGNIQLGEENTGSACRAGRAALILVASDAAENAFHRARTFSHAGKTTFIRVPYTKEELGALTDAALAQSFVRALGQPEKYGELLAELDARVARIRQRQREEKAHRNNIRHGKK